MATRVAAMAAAGHGHADAYKLAAVAQKAKGMSP